VKLTLMRRDRLVELSVTLAAPPAIRRGSKSRPTRPPMQRRSSTPGRLRRTRPRLLQKWFTANHFCRRAQAVDSAVTRPRPCRKVWRHLRARVTSSRRVAPAAVTPRRWSNHIAIRAASKSTVSRRCEGLPADSAAAADRVGEPVQVELHVHRFRREGSAAPPAAKERR